MGRFGAALVSFGVLVGGVLGALPWGPGQGALAQPPHAAGFDLASLTTEGGLTADRAAESARGSSPSLARARSAVALAQAGSDQAWLGVLPRIDLSARYTRLSDVAQGRIGPPPDPVAAAMLQAQVGRVSDPEARGVFGALLAQASALTDLQFPLLLNQYVLRAELSYRVSELFTSAIPAYQASLSMAAAERLRSEAEVANVDLQARQAFYAYARARAAEVVARSATAQIAAQRDRLAVLVRGGAVAPVDLTRMDARLASTRVAAAQARGGVAIAAHALRTLMHDDGSGPLDIGEDLTEPMARVPGTASELLARAVRDRLELQAMERLIEGRDSLVTAQAGRRWPRLVVSAGVDYANPNLRVFPQESEFRGTWDVSAILSWSPNDALGAGAEVSTAEAQLEQARADRDTLTDALRLQVTQAFETQETAFSVLEAAQAGLVAAEASYHVRDRQLRAGAASSSDLLDAETELTTARLQLLDALIATRVARASLLYAVGDGPNASNFRNRR